MLGEPPILEIGYIGDEGQTGVGFITPLPGVSESLRLRSVLTTLIVVNLKIISFRIEWGINVTEVYRLWLNFFS